MDLDTCDICLEKYKMDNPKIPLHKLNNNDFHYICYNCILNIKDVLCCPFCKQDTIFFIKQLNNDLDDDLSLIHI